MPTARLCPLADVAGQIPASCWLAERLAQGPGALANDTVLCITGDLVLPALHLNGALDDGTALTAAFPEWTGSREGAKGSPSLILVAGDLHINGALTSNPATPTSESPAHLVVLGDVHAGNAVLSGAQIHIQGALRVDDLLWSHGDHGSVAPRSTNAADTMDAGNGNDANIIGSTLHVMGGTTARVALFTGNAPPQLRGAEQAEFLIDGVRPVPHRAEFSSEIMGAVFAPAFHSGIHDGERRAGGLAGMLDRERLVAAVRAERAAARSSADIHAEQPLASDLCAGDAITAQNILAVVRSPVMGHKEQKAAGWFGTTDFLLCQRHVDEEGDARDDSVFITVWKTWDFYLAVDPQPATRGPLHKLASLLARKAAPTSPQLTLAYRRYTNGQPGAWQALQPSATQGPAPGSQPCTGTGTDAGLINASRMHPWQACQQAWRGVLDYVRKAVGQHRARYPLHQRLQHELTAVAVEDFTSLPVFTEHYNNWWDSDHNGWWEGDLWIGARQPCMHNGEPWGRVLKLSWRNGDEAAGDAPDNAHSAYQLDVDEARSGPPVVEVSYSQRQNDPRATLPRGAADHIARLLRFYALANTHIRARHTIDRAHDCA